MELQFSESEPFVNMYKNRRRRRTCEFALETVCCCDIHQGDGEVQLQIEIDAMATKMI